MHTPTHPRSSLPARLLCLLIPLLLLAGCASSQSQLGDFNALFAQHKYPDAYDAAAKVAASRANNREQASLVAGLSARALDRNDDAKRWLTPVASGADTNIAGQASAALGAIAHEQGQHREALNYFTVAGTKLKGDDAAHALMWAGDELRALKKPVEAKAMYEKANTQVQTDSQLRVAIGDRLHGAVPPPTTTPRPTSASGKYTVQAGAFSTQSKATAEARKLAKRGTTRTVPITDRSGRKLYAVQVGRFQTKQDAERFMVAMGSGGIVTMATE